jgi:pimeloyl-ACP methyl ester carboxylesterase
MIHFARSGSRGRRSRVWLSLALFLVLPCYAGAQSGVIDMGDAQISYESAGQGMAVVFIHGWALNLREWDDQMAALAPRFRVVAFDRRGYGKSTGHADISAEPGDLRALLDTLGIGRAVLVGHSAGAQVVYRFGAAFPDRTAGMVLYGGGPPPGFPIARSTPRPNFRDIARRFGLDSLRKFVGAQPGFSDLRTPAIGARINAMWATYSGKDLLEDHPQSGRFPMPRFDDVKGWSVPALFIVGDREAPYARLIADSLSRWMPNARSVTIPGGGHGVHFQQPERFNAALLAFLMEVAKGCGRSSQPGCIHR